MEYHWKYHRESFPPVVTHPEGLTHSDRLCLACTQTDLPSRQQAALVRQWCQLLPTLESVRTLYLTTRAPQVLFEAVCSMPHLEGLWIKWSGVKSIAALQQLTKLRYFHLGSSTALRSIAPLGGLTQLKWLGLENLKLVTALDPLGTLPQLEGLTLEGSMWNVWKVRSLAPLGALHNLRYLSLAALRAEDHTLAPLFALRALESLTIAKWWDEGEVQEIHRRNPKLAA